MRHEQDYRFKVSNSKLRYLIPTDMNRSPIHCPSNQCYNNLHTWQIQKPTNYITREPLLSILEDHET